MDAKAIAKAKNKAETHAKAKAAAKFELAKRQSGGKAMSAAAKKAKKAKPTPLARAKAPQLGGKVANDESDDITSKLERLSAMFKEGLLDVGEFKAAKAAIIKFEMI